MSDVSEFWQYTVEGTTDIVIYTANLSVLKEKKLKKSPSGWYYRKGKLFAVQYTCREDEPAYKFLYSLLGLTPEDEKKEKRRRRTKAEMEQSHKQD